MSRGRLSQSIILEELLKEDEEESESELSDQGSETSDHIVAEEPLSAEESNCSDSEEDDLQLYAGKQPEGLYQLTKAASSHTTFICNQCYMDKETDSDEN
ncbi:hypothetical protein K1T71_004857 [Dendrolimus kikuchii]|uniref:Uncharacterized protein n=1 Tax=Dendrolimus kikuchii TaxID=765133 RepID=A0ACC1D5K9_9NEOP|nr:hypothetical protein K1T71_004857 [Dendrolimus kikuchii]